MNMMTHNKTIDFDAIYTGLMEQVEQSSKAIKNNDAMSLAQFIREYRTIGILAPRQCGKTRWVCKMLRENPETSALFYNLDLMKDVKTKVDVSDCRLLTRGYVYRGLHGMGMGISPAGILGNILIVDNAQLTLDSIGLKNFYKWVAALPNADEITVVLVG